MVKMVKKYSWVAVVMALRSSLPTCVVLTVLATVFVVQHAAQSAPTFSSFAAPLGPSFLSHGSVFRLDPVPQRSTLQDENFLHDHD
jgi:hypothetical protein